MPRANKQPTGVTLIPLPAGPTAEGPRRQKFLVMHDDAYRQGDFGRVDLTDATAQEGLLPHSTNFIAALPNARRKELQPLVAPRTSHAPRRSASALSFSGELRFHDASPISPRPAWQPKWSTLPAEKLRSGQPQDHGLETVDPNNLCWWLQARVEKPFCANRTPTAASKLPCPAVGLRDFQRTAASFVSVGSPVVPRDARIVLQAARLTPRFQEELATIRTRLQTAQTARARPQSNVAALLAHGAS